MKKVELEEKISKLESQIASMNEFMVDRKVQAHKDGYIHIPFSWSGFYRGLACLGGFLLMLLNLYVVYYSWNHFNIGECFKPISKIVASNISPDMLMFLYPFFTWFFSVWLFMILCKMWHDGGWNDLDDLIFVLAISIIAGIVLGLIFGIAIGLIVGLIVGLVVGLVICLIVALIFSFVIGLIVSIAIIKDS